MSFSRYPCVVALANFCHLIVAPSHGTLPTIARCAARTSIKPVCSLELTKVWDTEAIVNARLLPDGTAKMGAVCCKYVERR